jgi:hypothetical protein
MPTLRDLAELFGLRIDREVVQAAAWPPGDLMQGNTVSVRRLLDRFGAAGEALRNFRQSVAPSAFAAVDRPTLAKAMRDRILDPATTDQLDTPLCGPASIALVLALKKPVKYVQVIRELFETGRIRINDDRSIEATEKLRKGPFPSPDKSGNLLNAADWILCASLRDDENWFWEVSGNDIKSGLAGGLATGFEMASWARDLLGRDVKVNPPVWPGTTLMDGEMGALRKAGAVAVGGGFGFLCIDSFLLNDGGDDDEEDMGWTAIEHRPGFRSPPSPFRHSKNDGILPDHWIAVLGDFRETGDRMTVRVWSWAREYVLSGSSDSLEEYLWGTVTGTLTGEP